MPEHIERPTAYHGSTAVIAPAAQPSSGQASKRAASGAAPFFASIVRAGIVIADESEFCYETLRVNQC